MRRDAICRQRRVHHRKGLHHDGDGLQAAHFTGQIDGGDGVNDMQDPLSTTALRGGQDGTRGKYGWDGRAEAGEGDHRRGRAHRRRGKGALGLADQVLGLVKRQVNGFRLLQTAVAVQELLGRLHLDVGEESGSGSLGADLAMR